MRDKNPVEQKESREYHTGDTVGGHEREIHAAQIIWLNQLVLVDEH